MLRPANAADRDRIRLWRNHPTVRSVSVTTHEIGADEHASWFSGVLIDPTKSVLIYEHDGIPSGVVTFTGLGPDGPAVWGFYLDNDGLERRGDTLAAWLSVQREAVAYAFDVLGVDELTGEVLEHNTVVRRMNRRLGFVEGEPVRKVIAGVPTLSYPISLRRPPIGAHPNPLEAK
jgi:RimJ/RimL family protein N-acetyltransferase